MITAAMSAAGPSARKRRLGALIVFSVAATVALAFALFTDNRWEDFYITYRASKNLALGNGLVFQPGQRVHSFTSPLGVLLPAFGSWVTGNHSDELALWVFRGLSIAAFGGAAALLWRLGVAWGWRMSVRWVSVALLVTDAKSVAFTINGMETAFMLLFLAWSIHAFVAGSSRGRWHLGLAWAGLMWTRPDSFIYIGSTAVAFWLFPTAQKLARSRRELLKIYFQAGVICTLIYGPWLVGATWYYGSPIPHTVLAKGLAHPHVTWATALWQFLTLPFRTWHSGAWDNVFMPAYSYFWPQWMIHLARSLVIIPLTAVVWPAVRAEARVTSFAAIAGVFYLSNIMIFPWYVPPVTFLCVLALASVAEAALATPRLPTWCRWTAGAALCFGLAVSLTLLVASAWQLKWQQSLVENQRREIGVWLHEHRKSDADTVFLEPLGYIGYFSHLKIFDMPGLASPEVIAARRRVGEDWIAIIRQLQPDWVVARPGEPRSGSQEQHSWFSEHYSTANRFDVSAQVAAAPHVLGRRFLAVDQTFVISHRNE